MLTLEPRQNNDLLNALSQKTSALKSVTADIYENAQNHDTIDRTVRFVHPPPSPRPAIL